MLSLTWRAFRLAWQEKADIFHFHDPELIPIGLLLKFCGKRVVYDVHEDLPRQILSKHWIPRWLRTPLARIAEVIEQITVQSFDAIVASTPAIAKRFPAKKTVVVQNFPLLAEFTSAKECAPKERSPWIVYVGGISSLRGIKEMVQAIILLPKMRAARLVLAGEFVPADMEAEIRNMPGWNLVDFLGWQSREGVAKLLERAKLGLALLHPVPNYLEAYPVKLFEYMAAGIPVIASNFPRWKEIVEGNECGLTIDPLNPQEIAQAIDYLLERPDLCQKMGENGRRAVREKYNWEKESEKLLKLYEELSRR